MFHYFRFPAFYKLLGVYDQLDFMRSHQLSLDKMGMEAIIKTSTMIFAVLLMFQATGSVLMATMDVAADMLPFRRYLDSEWINPGQRVSRSFKMHLSEKDVSAAKGFAEGIVDRLGRHEQSLMWGEVVPPRGTSSYAAMIASWADDKALQIAREAFVNNKAAVYLASKNCGRYGMSNSYCADQMKRYIKPCDDRKKCTQDSYRSYDGSCNNEFNPSLGTTYSPYARYIRSSYDDGLWEPRGAIKRLPNPIDISEIVKDTELAVSDTTLAVTAWGNLVANDLSHAVANRMMNTGENIMCCSQFGYNLAPRNRHPLCMPLSNGHNKCFNYVRSMLSDKHKCQLGAAQQMNAATHFLDGSGIYGSTEEVALSLRSFEGGRLKVELINGKQTLPKTKATKCHHDGSCYLTGELRVNIDTVSVVLHTLLVREHNRIVGLLSFLNPHWDDEKLFQEARRIVIAEVQHITYNEWLPVILGHKEIEKQPFLQFHSAKYSNGVYNKNVDPSVLNSFANAAMKFIISMIDEQISLYDEKRNFEGSVLLREAIIKPNILDKEGIFDSFVRGLATQNSQASDLSYTDAITKYFYSMGNGTGMNGISLAIQRGRDHGLPPYVEMRKQFGLSHQSFDKLSDSMPKEAINKLKKAYRQVSEIDLFVGGMAETPVKGGILGPVFSNIIAKQFVLTRTGDLYFYDNKQQPQPFSSAQIKEIKKTSIARLLCDNGDKLEMMQSKAFLKPHSERNSLLHCYDTSAIPELNLKAWQERR